MNMLGTIIAALIPLVVGFVWYNPKLFGTAWMKESGLAQEDLKKVNMAKLLGFTLLFSFMAAFFINSVTIHQFGAKGALFNDLKKGASGPRFDEALKVAAYFSKKGESLDVEGKIKATEDGMFANNHRSFGHGFLHGGILAIFLILPILGVNALFERRSWKYIFIHLGYWFISLGLMGGVVCLLS